VFCPDETEAVKQLLFSRRIGFWPYDLLCKKEGFTAAIRAVTAIGRKQSASVIICAARAFYSDTKIDDGCAAVSAKNIGILAIREETLCTR